MNDYSTMPALDVWYDRIDAERLQAAMPSDEDRERLEGRLGKEHAKSAPEHLFPKLAEHRGTLPRIKDDPPLIFHPTA